MKISLCVLCSFLLIALMTAPAALAQGNGEELEKQAQEIDQMIMCPVCPAETIDQAQVEISFQMRALIREMLAEGSTKEEILDYFVDRYGPDILAAPPKSGANLLAWILPIVGMAAGIGGVYLVIRAMAKRERPQASATPAVALTPEQDDPEQDNPELAPYLEIADRLLASRRRDGRAAPNVIGPESLGIPPNNPGGPATQGSPDHG